MIPASILLLGFLSTPPSAQGLTGFTGTWERDGEKSDDPKEKIQAALQKMVERRSRGGGRPPGGPGGPPGNPGHESGLGRAADEIHVEVEGVEVRIDDGERVQIYFLDGEKHRRELPDGTKLETVARKLGSAIVIEEKFDRGKIETKLELGEEGRTLVVSRTIRLERWKEPVVIRSVYDFVEPGGRELPILLESFLFIGRENVHDFPGRRLRPGNDPGDIGILPNGALHGFPTFLALHALLGFEALLFLARPLFLTFEKRLSTTVSH